MDEIVPPHSSDWAPRTTPAWRLRLRLRLRRRDRHSADLARQYGSVRLLGDAAQAAGAGWVRTTACGRCGGVDAFAVALADREPFGAPSARCLVCTLVRSGGPTADENSPSVRAAVDRTWRSLHRRGHRPVHWNPAVMHLLQAQELRRWNDRPTVTAGQVTALLRTAQRHAAGTLHDTRTAARPRLAAQPRG